MFKAIIKRLRQNEKGFTLIELMVVVAIIGILAAGIIPQFMKATENAKIGAAKADMANFQTVLEIIYAEEGKYPLTGDGFDTMQEDGYIKDSTPSDPWDGNYVYTSATGTDYAIEDSEGKVTATPGSITP